MKIDINNVAAFKISRDVSNIGFPNSNDCRAEDNSDDDLLPDLVQEIPLNSCAVLDELNSLKRLNPKSGSKDEVSKTKASQNE